MNRIAIVLCLMLMIPLSAWSADIVATWQHKGGNTMKLAMRDENHVRMDTGEGSYMLVSGKKVYMISMQNGQWTVMDMDKLAGLMSGFGVQPGDTNHEVDSYQSSFKKTGRTETIAGYKGNVYVAETKDGSGQLIDSNEIVFSKHKDIERASKAWMTIAMRMGSVIGNDTSLAVDRAAKKAETSDYGGILRIDEMKLVSIDKPSLGDSHFELPKGAKMMDMNIPRSGGDRTGNQGDDSNFAKDLGEDAGKAAQDEVKQNTIDEVKKGVGGLFKSIFK